jgi:hypothetical protein
LGMILFSVHCCFGIVTLQRYLTRCRLPSPFSVRQKGTVVALLSPCYQVEDVRNRQGF